MKRLGLFETLLPNGLQVVHLRTGPSSLFEASVYFPVGSRDETEATSGISHLLEHMMFRGSGPYETSLAFSRALEALCGETNAFTSAESTEFWFQCAGRFDRDLLVLLRDFLMAPRLGEFETEQRIILKEMADDYNEAGLLTDDHTLAMRAHFGSEGLGLPIGGTPEGLSALKRELVQDRAAALYRPDNAVITIQSPKDWDVIKALCTEIFTPWQKAKPKSLIPAPSPQRLPTPGPHLVGVPNPDNQYTLRYSFALPKDNPTAQDARESLHFGLACEALERVLDDGTSSRLQAKVREEKGYVYAISAQCDEYRDARVFWIAATVDAEHLALTHRAIWEELTDLSTKGPTEDELSRVLTRAEFDLEKLEEHHHEFLEHLLEARFRGENFDVESKKKALSTLTPGAVKTAAATFFHPKALALVLVGPDAPSVMKSLKF